MTKVKDLNPYIPASFISWEKEIMETSFSKEGFAAFREKTGKYLLVSLEDEHSISCFDKDGTFPDVDPDGTVPAYEGTGAFAGTDENGDPKVRKVGKDAFVKVWAKVPNLFDVINLFENGVDIVEVLKG